MRFGTLALQGIQHAQYVPATIITQDRVGGTAVLHDPVAIPKIDLGAGLSLRHQRRDCDQAPCFWDHGLLCFRGFTTALNARAAPVAKWDLVRVSELDWHYDEYRT